MTTIRVPPGKVLVGLTFEALPGGGYRRTPTFANAADVDPGPTPDQAGVNPASPPAPPRPYRRPTQASLFT